jgi:hypothetical protein
LFVPSMGSRIQVRPEPPPEPPVVPPGAVSSGASSPVPNGLGHEGLVGLGLDGQITPTEMGQRDLVGGGRQLQGQPEVVHPVAPMSSRRSGGEGR